MLPVEAPAALIRQPEGRDRSAEAERGGKPAIAGRSAAPTLPLCPLRSVDWAPITGERFCPARGARMRSSPTATRHQHGLLPATEAVSAAPSAGYLVAAEYWSREDGTLVHKPTGAGQGLCVGEQATSAISSWSRLTISPRPVLLLLRSSRIMLAAGRDARSLSDFGRRKRKSDPSADVFADFAA